MKWLKKLFGTEKPIIAMLHLDALPGDPEYTSQNSMRKVTDSAKQDLENLQEGGVDGVLISNEFSLPYQRRMSFVTPSAMARVIGELLPQLSIPYGVDCISDALATIELSAAVDAQFARGTFSGVYVGDGGFYNNDFSFLLRRKHDLGLDELKLLYFLNPESDRNLDTREISNIAKSLAFKANPGGFCISGNAAGIGVDPQDLLRVKEAAPGVPVMANTGCNLQTIAAMLANGDAAVVGTTFKEEGNFRKHVDRERVRNFMRKVKEIRADLLN